MADLNSTLIRGNLRVTDKMYGDSSNLSVVTTTKNGVMSATDKSNLDAIYGSLFTEDSDTVVNRLKDVLTVFSNFPEGTNVLEALNSKAPTSHASSETTYGIGTTSNYGHVKLATGDMNGASHADGVAVSKNHTHGQYLPTSGGTMTGALNFGENTDNLKVSLGCYSSANGMLAVKARAPSSATANIPASIGLIDKNADVGTIISAQSRGDSNTNVNLTLPSTSGTISLISDIVKNQATVSIISGFTQNINAFIGPNSTYTKFPTDSEISENPTNFINGMYKTYTDIYGHTYNTPYVVIKTGNNSVGYSDLGRNISGPEYMEYMTGSKYLPIYEELAQKQVIFIKADDFTFWKPQWTVIDTTTGAGRMFLFYLGAVSNCREITYSKLVDLRDNNYLIPGMQYRITDYTCTTTQANTQSAGHAFDIIVRADSTNKLSEEACAILHSGDTYFTSSKLEAWQLKYSLDNDTTRFAWADSTNGKGVIYYMKDEFNNECPYDFKNVLFTQPVAEGETPAYTNAYTFTYTENSSLKDASLLASKKCYGNIIKEYVYSDKFQLNFNVFYSTSTTFTCNSNTFDTNCHHNTFGYTCYHNTFGANCHHNTLSYACNSNTFGLNCFNNTFGNSCQSNTFGNHCSGNTFGYNYQSNTFGYSCTGNTFGYTCTGNTFGNSCQSNTFGYSCTDNTLDHYCTGNTFGNVCGSNTFGNRCQSNTFGNYCSGNTFGSVCSNNAFGNIPEGSTTITAIDWVRYVILENGCSYLYIISSDTTASSSNHLQNVHIHEGVFGTNSSKKTITIPDRNLAYSTEVYATGVTEMFI